MEEKRRPGERPAWDFRAAKKTCPALEQEKRKIWAGSERATKARGRAPRPPVENGYSSQVTFSALENGADGMEVDRHGWVEPTFRFAGRRLRMYT